MVRLRAGSVVAGRYRIERLLSRGGQAAVYLAHDTKFDERVALKVAVAATPAGYARLRERFRREARIGNRLGRTAGFVRAFDWGEVPDRPRHLYLALDLVEGAEPLDLESGTREERLARLRSAARIVAEAHRQGVVHRDIKPENFLQAPDGAIALTDFGLAKLRGDADGPRRAAARARPRAAAADLTRTGDWQGTPLFMAPEQFEDMRGTDARADVYALGVMLFFAVTGEYPYARAVLKRQQKVREGQAEAPRLRDRAPDAPAALDALCARAMALDRERRLRDVDAFLAGLDAALTARRARRPRLVVHEGKRAGGPRPMGSPATRGAPARLRSTTRGGREPPRLPRGLRRGEHPGEYVCRRDGSVLVWVPPGAYVMGSDAADAWGNERPAHEVTLTRGFFLGRFQVTWGQFARFCAKTGHGLPAARFVVADDHPVHDVSWRDARAYCEWAGLRLPTEAEWEWAARGGDGRRYPWGDDPPTPRHAQWIATPAQGTAPVGSFLLGASPVGCHDMAGNLWEWVHDGYGDYPEGPVTDPTGVPRAKHRVCRGGAWSSTAPYIRATSRCGVGPAVRYLNVGFRVARSLE
ncbi:MAG: bifunctional serine/threonine-protein kinase/formylglycine-generating enzyme family protein [Planctomycetes bacterium]|nr:bifunctional serine/threonine-protein kinase/formylglycine-generating enzyme family protein [Planctomycetota bacterium]